MRELVVDLEAIRANVAATASQVAPARLMGVVKADGYGHGMVPVAEAMVEAGIDALGVVDLDEARCLREAGIGVPILAWIHGSAADFAWAVAHGVELGVGSLDLLERVALAGSASAPAVVHLKADTGLGRGGALGEAWRALVARAAELETAGILEVRGVWTHLANTSLDADEAQFIAFDTAISVARDAGLTPAVEHASASGAMVTHPGQARGMVRAGIALYGISTFPDRTSADLGLRPAMELAAEVVAVKRVPAGLGVSYGHHYVTERETTLALIPLGYADGLPRAAMGRGPIAINGRRYTVAGSIAMDQVVVDVGDDSVEVGDRAVAWGDPARGYPSAADWAEASGTIAYEIVTRVGPRATRRYRS